MTGSSTLTRTRHSLVQKRSFLSLLIRGGSGPASSEARKSHEQALGEPSLVCPKIPFPRGRSAPGLFIRQLGLYLVSFADQCES